MCESINLRIIFFFYYECSLPWCFFWSSVRDFLSEKCAVLLNCPMWPRNKFFKITLYQISLCECIALKFFLQRSLLVGSISDILNFEMSECLIQSLQVFLGLPRPKHPLTTKFVISFIALVLQHAQTSGDAGCFQVIYTKSVQDEKWTFTVFQVCSAYPAKLSTVITL